MATQLVQQLLGGEVARQLAAADELSNSTVVLLQGKRPSHFFLDVHIGGASRNETSHILSQNGFFLGASRDAWIVLFICLAGLAISYVLILASVARATKWRAEAILSEEIPHTAFEIKKPVFDSDFLRRVIFAKDQNWVFAENASLALRCALPVALFGLTYWVPSFTFVNSKGWSMQYVAVIIAFSVYMDMGTTVNLAWQNFYGTLLPTLNVFFMYSLFPDGTRGDGDAAAFYFGLADFVIFCGLFLVLNWPIGVRMFALSWQAYFSMCFLNPNDDTVFSHGLDDIVLEGAAVGPLVGTVLGCVISILVVAPSPLGHCVSGLGMAQEISMAVACDEAQQWSRLVQCFRGVQSYPKLSAIAMEADSVRQKVDKLDALLASNAWYECFDVGLPGKIRSHLLVLRETYSCIHDWLDVGIHSRAGAAADSTHKALLMEVGQQLLELVDSSSVLLFRAAGMAASGFTPTEGTKNAKSCDLSSPLKGTKNARGVAELLQGIQAVSALQQDLAERLVKARSKIYGADVVTAAMVKDHTFIFSVSAYSCLVLQFVEYLLQENQTRRRMSLFQACLYGIKQTMQIMGVQFIIRSSLAFFLAWVLGYFGWRHIFRKYGATAAGTSAFLLAAEGKRGSAIMKNVARFQGVAAGCMLGYVLYRGFVICERGGVAIAVVMFGIYQFFAYYLYFSSNNYGYVGLLMAAFGAESVLLHCGETGAIESDAIYKTLIDQTGAIICVTLADLLVGNTSASTIATNDFFDLMSMVKSSLEKFLGTNEGEACGTRTCFHDINQKIARAEDDGQEAMLEPRLKGIPFKSNLWAELCRCGRALGHKVCIMEYLEALPHCGNVLRVLHDVVTLRVELMELDDRAEACLRVAKQVMLNDTYLPPQAPSNDVEQLLKPKAPFTRVLEDTLKAINENLVDDAQQQQQPQQRKDAQLASVMQEDLARAEVLLFMLWSIHDNIAEMEDLILTSDSASLQKYFHYIENGSRSSQK